MMHLALPHGATAAVLLGVAVWLAGLTLILVLKNRAEHRGRSRYAWMPLTIYLVASAVALVVAGYFYRHEHHGASSAAAPPVAKAAAKSKVTLAPSSVSKPLSSAKPAVPSPPAGSDDASLDSDLWPSGADESSTGM